MLKYFSKQLFTLMGSVVGAGIAVTISLHLCYVFQYFHHMVSFLCCMTEKICDAAESIVIMHHMISIFEACASLVIAHLMRL
jgi:hypothetical protein